MTLALWFVALVALAVLFLVFWRGRSPNELPERTEKHEGQIQAVHDWLTEPKIVRAIISNRMGTYTGLQSVLNTVETLNAETVEELVKILLSNRNVRRVIADHIESSRHIKRQDALKALAKWAGVEVA